MNLGLDAIESEDADASPPAPAPPAAAKRPKSTATRTRTGKVSRRKPDQTERQTSTTGITKTTVLLPSELWEFARAWTAESSRSNADLVLTAQHRHLATLEGTYGKAACPDDPEEWEFFVVPTARIDHVCGRQASITLTSISGSLDPGRCRVAGLRAAIFQSASR